MKKFVLLSLVFFVASCHSKPSRNQSETEISNDSIRYYYKVSLQKNSSIENQYKAINKAFKFLKRSNNDSIFSNVLYQKSLLHFNLKQYDSLLYFTNLFTRDTAYTKHKYNLGLLFYLRAYYFQEIAQIPDSSFVNYNNSKNYYLTLKDSFHVAKNLLNMAILQKNQNDFFGSKETIIEALQFFDKKKDSSSLSSAYTTLAANHRKLLNCEDAINYYLKAMAITNSTGNKLIIQNNLGATYIDNKQYKKSIALFSNIIKDTSLNKNSKNYARVLDNLSYAKWLNGTAISHVEKDMLKALQIRTTINDKRGKIASYTHLGALYAKTHPKQAKRYFDSVIHSSKVLKMPVAETDVLKQLITLQPENLEFRDRFEFLQDSLQTGNLNVKTQFAKYKYDDRLKQEKILRLQKEKAEKNLELSKERSYKIIAFLGFLVACSTVVLISNFFKKRTIKLKQQNEVDKLETMYRTEAELSRRIHDDFGAKLNHAMMLVQNKPDSLLVLDTLEGLYNQSRDFSREINDIDTGKAYYKYLLAELKLHTSDTVKLFIWGGNTIDWNAINPTNKKVIYKVLRELMINMKKHSKATTVTITYKSTAKHLEILYSDNGIGATKNDMFRKNGLKNTEKRISAIRGSITFDIEGQGFKACIRIPN